MSSRRRRNICVGNTNNNTCTHTNNHPREDSFLNRYSLFGDSSKASSTTNHQNQNHHHSLDDNDNDNNTSEVSTGVIYNKDYPLDFAFFAPLATFLGLTFCILLVLRIVVSILTYAMGMIVVLIAVASAVDFVRDISTNTRRMVQSVHSAPVVYFSLMGTIVGGATRTIWVGRWLTMQTATETSAVVVDETWVVWGMLQGLVYGVEVGALWLVFLGNQSDPSSITLWLLRLWKRLLHFLQRRQDDDVEEEGPEDETVRRCIICLERFGNEGSTRQVLPLCLHGFHRTCLEQWTRIKPTCPICRLPTARPVFGVKAMTGDAS
jgi:hypothetical protein